MSKSKNIYLKENLIKIFLSLSTLISVLTTLGIIISLLTESLPFFQEGRFFALFKFGTLWDPRSNRYSIWPLFTGTLMIVIFSSLFALPLGLGSAIYLSEYSNPKLRNILKPILEILAGIPSVVYGFFAFLYITPLLKKFPFWEVDTYNVLSASFAVGIMITPLVASISEDALKSVPSSLREASLALGATKFETVWKVTVPAAVSGIVSSFILAISRAIGETMVVSMAAGSKPVLNLNPLGQIQTMTAYMVSKSFGEVPVGSLEYQTVFVIGLILFLMTLTLNILAKKIITRFREVY